ncbi:MAG: ABC transporter ATP-binding protein [Eubacteriales bacterium]
MKLTIERITKEFKGKTAVRDLSVELSEGVYGFLGPNGSGKSTLMRMIVDILKPTSGRILVNGKDITVMGDNYRDLIGYLPQNSGYYKNFTAHRFLMYIASLKGLNKERALNRVEELLEIVNLKSDVNKKMGTFSGGMRQRIGIAQALLNDPKILILDEPTAGLDPKERIRFRNLISEISANRIVILSTHIVSDIEYIAKEIILIKEGELLKMDQSVNILWELKGKVWSAIILEEELSSIKKSARVGNLIRRGNEVEVRLVSKEKPLSSAIEEKPRLEDMYLYYFDMEVEE